VRAPPRVLVLADVVLPDAVAIGLAFHYSRREPFATGDARPR
jgi:hypothetical protein